MKMDNTSSELDIAKPGSEINHCNALEKWGENHGRLLILQPETITSSVWKFRSLISTMLKLPFEELDIRIYDFLSVNILGKKFFRHFCGNYSETFVFKAANLVLQVNALHPRSRQNSFEMHPWHLFGGQQLFCKFTYI